LETTTENKKRLSVSNSRADSGWDQIIENEKSIAINNLLDFHWKRSFFLDFQKKDPRDLLLDFNG